MRRAQRKLTLPTAFKNAEPRPSIEANRIEKKNYAERLSRQLAQVFADELRPYFDGILPNESGQGQESKVRISKGFKKLDVNYSTIQLGLALGVSIKTINFPDRSSKRFTKNYSRNENELRAEATDYHKRQPWAVLIALIFLPVSSCIDATARIEGGASSFGSAVRFFRNIARRKQVDEDADRFEAVYIGLYDPTGEVRFFNVETPPPKRRQPTQSETIDLAELIAEIRGVYDGRNSPPFRWADDPSVETEPLGLEDEADD
jgi:hypothetical protein